MKIQLNVVLCVLFGSVVAMAGSWQHIGLSGDQVISLETDPVDSQYIYAGTTIGLYITEDGGQFWAPGLPFNARTEYLANYPLSADTILKIIGGGSNSDGLYFSTNQGVTWDVICYLLNPRRVGFDPVDTGLIYICLGDGILTSENLGQTFAPANNGLPDFDILDVMGDGRNSLEAYAVGQTFVAHTLDFGNNWSSLGGLFGMENYNPARIAHDAINPETLYVSCYAYVAISENGGLTWRYTHMPGTGYQAIACDQQVSGKLFVGSSDSGGVFESIDAGASFVPINGNLGNLNIYSLKFTPDGKLLAGTANGVYKYDFNVGIGNEQGANPIEYSLSQNYPNPFNANTIIKFSAPINENVSLAIYDIGGKLVRNLYGGMTGAENCVIWDGTNDVSQPVAGGIYFYRLENSAGAAIRKMMYLK
jgi:hypothetical protein